MMLSCLQLVRSFRSADNIWERSRSSKRATVRGREFVFHQQYREAGMGVGSALWDGSVILSEYLMRECDIRGKRVLVVGAGLGLEAMAAAIAGAAEVLCTDGDELLLPLTRENIASNLSEEEAKSIEVKALLWGQEDHMEMAKQWGTKGPFDVILAADVVYESSINMGTMMQAYEGLFETFLNLSTSKTLILLAYKERFATEPLFFNVMNEYFVSEKVDLPDGMLTPMQAESGTRVFRYTKKSGEGTK